MTPKVLRLFTESGLALPYLFRLSPGPRMMKLFIEHYIFEFLEPESLTSVGAIDLLEVRDVISEENFRKSNFLEAEKEQQLSIFFIEADTDLDCSYYIAGLKLY
mmetsp:Transcript_19614/g.17350  ORF Transcript_19614/g.17350 Transcript_19614/m.17350 type:complete len:104 (+) Transcript_19614:193-504(+)